jgi:ribosomal protein S18 acetylase RimI-like enzyme
MHRNPSNLRFREYQGKKVGQILFKVLTIAHQSQVKYIWLGVWEGNYKAIGFYAKMDLSHLTNIFYIR